ncbi:unnamed protein product [Penicillium olsonii]|nr:unnamed protein product [Penicillium olsonii]CAG7925811.1 unnamed protein product [Penicillium olsonii]
MSAAKSTPFQARHCVPHINAMDLSALRLSAGITKSSNRQGRRPGKSACVACHSRKKRCDAAPPHYQCSFCTKEDQLCIPRDPTERPARHRIPSRNTMNMTNCTIKQPEKEKESSLPPGIDHEIPRWSAMYSFYSEMQRLLPSPTPSSSPDIEDDRPAPQTQTQAQTQNQVQNSEKGKRPVIEAEHEAEPKPVAEEPRPVEPEPETQKNHTPGPSVDSPEVGHIKGISMPASQTRSASPLSQHQVDSRSSLESGASRGHAARGAERGRDFHGHGEGFMNDLDALLRF